MKEILTPKIALLSEDEFRQKYYFKRNGEMKNVDTVARYDRYRRLLLTKKSIEMKGGFQYQDGTMIEAPMTWRRQRVTVTGRMHNYFTFDVAFVCKDYMYGAIDRHTMRFASSGQTMDESRVMEKHDSMFPDHKVLSMRVI